MKFCYIILSLTLFANFAKAMTEEEKIEIVALAFIDYATERYLDREYESIFNNFKKISNNERVLKKELDEIILNVENKIKINADLNKIIIRMHRTRSHKFEEGYNSFWQIINPVIEKFNISINEAKKYINSNKNSAVLFAINILDESSIYLTELTKEKPRESINKIITILEEEKENFNNKLKILLQEMNALKLIYNRLEIINN